MTHQAATIATTTELNRTQGPVEAGVLVRYTITSSFDLVAHYNQIFSKVYLVLFSKANAYRLDSFTYCFLLKYGIYATH